MARLLIVICLLAGGALFAQDENYLEGTTQPTTGSVAQGATQRHCISFAILRLTSNGDTFAGLTVRNLGTATATDYTQMQLWWDANDSDTFEPTGPDTLIGTAPSGAFPRTFPSITAQSIPGVSVFNYFVSVDVSPTATVGATFLFEVTISDVQMLTYPVILFSTQPTGTTQTVTGSGANQLVVTQQPAGAQPNTAFTTQPVLELRNAGGSVLTGDNTTVVTAAITTGTGTSGAVLSGTLTAQASAGVVSFGGLMIDLAGTGYSLTFTATGFTSANSTTFNVGTPQTATQLAIITQPGGAAPGVAFTSQPIVEIRDASGAIVTGATHFVAVSLNGGSGGTLSGTLIVQAVSGTATFTNLSINQAGTGYSLTFSAVNLTSATSTNFDVLSTPGSSSSGGGGGGGGGGCAAGSGSTIWLLGLLVPLAVWQRRRRLTA